MSKIVGHKTLRGDDGELRHEPLYENEAAEILKRIENEKKIIAELMPDQESALLMLGRVNQRLRDFGWREAIYCPKDGSLFDVIEFGSTGIHTANYEGSWPDGKFYVYDDSGDMWPSRPIMYRRKLN